MHYTYSVDDPLPAFMFSLSFIRASVRRTETCCEVTLSMCFRPAAWTSSELSLVYHLILCTDGTWLISKSWQFLLSGNFHCCVYVLCDCTQLKASFSVCCLGELVSCIGQSWKIVLYRSNFVMVHLQYWHTKIPCECTDIYII